MCFNSTDTPHLTNERKGQRCPGHGSLCCVTSAQHTSATVSRGRKRGGLLWPPLLIGRVSISKPSAGMKSREHIAAPVGFWLARRRGDPITPTCCDVSTPRSPPGTVGLWSNWWTVQTCQLLAELLLRVTEAHRAKELPLSCGVASTCILGVLLRNTRDCPRSECGECQLLRLSLRPFSQGPSST